MILFAGFFLIFFTILSTKRFSSAISVFLFLLPTYLLRFHIGPFPTTLLELMLLVLCAVWIFHEQPQKKIQSIYQKLRSEPSLLLAIGIFLLSATAALISSVDLRSALGEWKAFYIEPVIFFFLIISSVTNEQTNGVAKKTYISRTILLPLLLSGVITSILAIYQHFTGWMVPDAFWAKGNSYRVTAWYGFPNGVGLFLAPLVPFVLFYTYSAWKNFSEKKEIKQKYTRIEWRHFIGSILAALCMIAAIIFAKSTGGLIGIVAGIGTLLLFSKKTRWWTVAAGILTIIFVLFVLPHESRIRTELLAQDRSGQIRVAIWAETVELLRAHPLTGAGLASYDEKISPYHALVHGERIEIFHHPHNIFLTLWVNIGLFGLLGFTWIVVWFYRAGIQSLLPPYGTSTEHVVPFLLGAMTSLMTTGLVDSPYIKNDLSIFFWTLVALLLLCSKNTYTRPTHT